MGTGDSVRRKARNLRSIPKKMRTEPVQYWQAPLLDEREPPAEVFHYTSAAGLEGIFRTRQFFSTDLAFLNDPTEFQYGARVVTDVLNEVLRRCPKEFLEEKRPLLYGSMTLGELAGKVGDVLPLVRSRFVFGAACLCEDGDLLSQWQGYGLPGGYAIGFDSAQLRERLSIQAVRLAPVVYSSQNHAQSLAESFASWVVRLASSEEPWRNQDEAMDELHKRMLGFAVQIKHPKFEGELEWRIADLELTTSTAVKFRQGSLGLTPYLEIDLCSDQKFPRLPVKSVVVGPGADYEIRMQSVRVMLENRGYPDVEVVQSSIPFRIM